MACPPGRVKCILKGATRSGIDREPSFPIHAQKGNQYPRVHQLWWAHKQYVRRSSCAVQDFETQYGKQSVNIMKRLSPSETLLDKALDMALY